MTDAIVITGGAALHAPDLDALPASVRTRASRAERVTQLLLAGAGAALARAGLAITDGDPRPRLGVVVGTGFGCFLTNAAYQRRFADGGAAAASPRLFAATVSNAAAGELAIAYRLGGPSVTLTAGAVAGLVAIAHAADVLARGQADALVVGGVDAGGDALDRWVADGGFGPCEPVSEGAAVLVLERGEHAERRGAEVRGVLHECTVAFDPDVIGVGPIPPGLAAAGPFDVWQTLERAPLHVRTTVSGRCPTGHVARVDVERRQ